jgi:MSHA biogenesis protein MshO
MRNARHWRSRSTGVTLVELVVVIVLTAILASMMAYFVAPTFLYADTRRRAEMTDIADTALRRIGRDLRKALPNSVRITNVGTVYYLELLLVRTGGRYRADIDATATNTCNDGASSVPANDVLSFRSADTCFKTLGNMPNIADVVSADYVVVFNLQPGTGNADAYQTATSVPTNCGIVCNNSRVSAAVAGAGSDRLTFASNTFTYESPGSRFFVVEGPVTYICDPGAKTLTRYSGYTIASSQPTPPGSGGPALLASNVSACTFTYDVIGQSQGLVNLALTLSSQDLKGSTESVNLYHAVHVSNVP